jgi:uncharacterized protein YjbI with pentapeptide repeats
LASIVGNITAGNVSATGNVRGAYILGDGSQLTGISITAGTNITNGTSNITVAANSNITAGLGGSTVTTTANTGFYVTGVISTSGTVTAANNIIVNSPSPQLEGGQIVLAWANISGLTAQGNSTWNVDVDGSNNFRIFYQNATGNTAVPITITQSTNAVSLIGALSAVGNVTGNYILGNGALLTGVITSVANINSGNSNVTVVSSGGNISVGVGGTSNVAVFATTGEYITGVLSASGNVTGGNVIATTGLTAGTLSLSGNTITSTDSIITIDPATAGVNGAVIIQGNLSVTGNVTYIDSNTVTTNDLMINVANNAATASAANGGGIGVGPATGAYATITYSSTSNTWVISNGANVSGAVSTSGNITGGNILGGANVNATLFTGTNVSVSGTVTAATVNAAAIGNSGAAFTGASISAATIGNSGAAFTGASISAATIGNTSAVVNGATVSITGTVTAASVVGGVMTGSSVSVSGTVTGASVVGGVMTGSSVSVSGAVTGAGITGSSLTVSTGNISGGNINNNNATGVGNIGTSAVTFNTVFAKATSAQYADLAEKYLADQEYDVGTVLAVGGTLEVTACQIGDRAIGAVSENPAFKMNDGLENGTFVALKGRVPVKVIGTVRKGQRLVAHNDGCAVAGVAHANDVFAVALESSDDVGVKMVEALIL